METLYCAECNILAFSPFLSSVRHAQQEVKLVNRNALEDLGEPVYSTYGSADWAQIEWLPRWQQAPSAEYPVNADHVIRLWQDYFSVEDIERDSIWAYRCDFLLPDMERYWESMRRYAQQIDDNGEEAVSCRLTDDVVQFLISKIPFSFSK